MIELENEITGFRIASSGMEVIYSDDGCLLIKALGVLEDGSSRSFLLGISFSSVAELSCKTLNFYEFNYESYKIKTEPNTRERISGVYRVLNSEYLRKVNKVYDPMERLDLKHYIVTGGDGFCEIVASGYSINKVPEKEV